MNKWYLIIDIEKCENCNNCLLACKDEHVDNMWEGYSAPQQNIGHKWIQIMSKERGQFPLIDVTYLPITCMHCDNAPCIKASTNSAIYKRKDGIVIIDSQKSKGQKHLVDACPYNAIWWNEKLEIPQKCTLCAHLLDSGWTKTRCVQSCPTGALSLKYINESRIQDLIKNENLQVLYSKYNTSPHVYYKNLYRFECFFVAGSVFAEINGKEECVEEATITIIDGNGNEITSTKTDCFGDFKIDGFSENNRKSYTIKISHPQFSEKQLSIIVDTSINIGNIKLQ